MLRVRSLRFRIALAYIIGTVGVAGFIAVGTYAITSRVLMRQSIERATQRSFDELGFLRDHIRSGQRGVAELLDDLRERDVCAVLVHPSNTAANCVSVSVGIIPRALKDSTEKGRVAYAFVSDEGGRRMVFGSNVPVVEPAINMYFFHPFGEVDRTLSILLRVLIGLVAVAGAISGGVGLRLADRTIRPLRAAADAARRVASGQLETRLEETGEDELSRLARDFNRMSDALEERIHRERRFVADASHELRTPLTALKTSIDYIADRIAELPPRVQSAVGLAADEVRSLGRLVDDLLELTRVEAGGVHVAREEVDLVDFAKQLVRRRAPDAAVAIDAPPELIVETDKTRLERVVGNLVENAVVHGAGKEVRITLDRLNGAARISVVDQGPGIDAEQLPRIFERFWRGDASRRRDGRAGSGLGLAIARENASLIGADLRVESGAGLGTRFEVVLPRGEQT